MEPIGVETLEIVPKTLEKEIRKTGDQKKEHPDYSAAKIDLETPKSWKSEESFCQTPVKSQQLKWCEKLERELKIE